MRMQALADSVGEHPRLLQAGMLEVMVQMLNCQVAQAKKKNANQRNRVSKLLKVSRIFNGIDYRILWL